MKVRRALVVALVAAAALVGAVRAQEDVQAMQPGSDDGDAEAVVERNDNTMDMQKQNAVDPENSPEARARHDAVIRAATIRAQKKYDRLEALAEKEDEREDQEDAKEDRDELRERRRLSDRLREAQQKHDRQQAEQMRRLEAETNKEDRQKREADEKTAASVARVEADRNRKVDQQIADWRAFEARQKQAGELEEKRVAELRVKAAEVESKRQKALEEQQKEQAQKRVVEETAKAKVEAANKAAAEVSSKAVERTQKTAAEQAQKKQEQAQKAQEQAQKQQEQAQKKQEQAQKQQAEQAQKARFRPWQWRTVAQRVCFSANQPNQGPAVEQSRFFVDAGVPVTITGWRLRHLSGGVSCSGPPQPGAFWGCGSAQSADMLSTWVVDANNFWVVPNRSVRGYIDRNIGPNVRGQTPWYMLSGQSNGSPTLQFLGSRVPVTSRTEFRVMYGEVATQWTLSDNHGTACVAVDVYYGTDGLQYP